jgi:peptide/nickel transport system permease protein
VFRFIVRRLLQLIPTLFGLSILLFIWLHRLPGGPETAILGERGTPETRAAIRRSMGLDEPILVQYGKFLRRMIRLDLGTSTSTKREVTAEFLQRFPGTVELTLTAMVIAIGVGIPLGYLAARRRGRFLDHAAGGGSLIGICIPVFFLAYVLGIFAGTGLVPVGGRRDPTIRATG